MASVFFLLCALTLFIGIISSSGPTRLIWFFSGIIFLQERIIVMDSPVLIPLHRFLVYTLLLAELVRPKEFYRDLLSFPLRKSLTIVFVGALCIGIFDKRHEAILSVYRSLDIFIQTFLVMFLCYVNIKRNVDWRQLFNFFLIASFILCTYGFYVFVTKSNPYDALITKTYHGASFFNQYLDPEEDRFRINSFVAHPIYYGYLLGVLLLLLLCHFVFKSKQRILYGIAIGMVFINLILTNSRTPLVSTFFGLVIFFLIVLNRAGKLKLIIYGSFVCLVLYNVPFVQKAIQSSVDIFQTGGQKTSGSSIDMRTMQLGASYSEFRKNMLFGNGFYYIKENLGYANADKSTSDKEFQGFESYIYELLIEQGITGILINIIFFASLGVYFLRHLRSAKQFAGLGFSIVVMFLVYSIGTGTLGSWIISMGSIGLLIGSVDYSVKFNQLRLEWAEKVAA